MSKKVLIIGTSPRKGGNSEMLAENFAKGATSAGNQVELISLHDKKVEFCKGCVACQDTMRCVIRDDADIVAQKMLEAEVVVFATPIYYNGMCGQMKTLLDRMNPLYPADYAMRDIYLLATCADDDKVATEGAVVGLQAWVDCFKKASLKGSLSGFGVDSVGEIKTHTTVLDDAFNMGKNV